MEHYVVLANITRRGHMSSTTPHDHATIFDTCAKAFDCSIQQLRRTLGPYDYVALVAAPDAKKMAGFSLALGTSDALKTLTLPCVQNGATEL